MDTSRTLKGSTLLRSADCLFSVLRPYSEKFFPFSILLLREVRDAVFFFLDNIYLRHASPQYQTCQPPKGKKMWDSEPRDGKSSEKWVKSGEMFQIS